MNDAIEVTGHAWQVMREQARSLVASGFLPKAIRTPEQAVAVILAGRELGLGPMQSCRAIHIIEGKPTLSAELMAGLVYQRVPGAKLTITRADAEACIVEASRPGQAKPTVVAFTIADARAAGLAGKDVWKKYGRAMLRSRAISEACRAVFPDATMGVYTPEELGANVDAEGVPVIDATPEREVQPAALPAPSEDAYRFAKGTHVGKSIRDVPIAYLEQLRDAKEHPITRVMRERVESEIDRRIAASERAAIAAEPVADPVDGVEGDLDFGGDDEAAS